MQITTKTFVVTGAGSGIGRELTLHLLQKGAFVAGVDINADALLETQELAGVGEDHFKGFTLDITNKEQVAQLPDTVIGHFGVVDGLINNAGIIQPFKPVNDLSMDEINRVFAVNFYGTLYLTKSFLPHFLLRPEAHIANVSSMGGWVYPLPRSSPLWSSKGGCQAVYRRLIRRTTGYDRPRHGGLPRGHCDQHYREFRSGQTESKR